MIWFYVSWKKNSDMRYKIEDNQSTLINRWQNIRAKVTNFCYKSSIKTVKPKLFLLGLLNSKINGLKKSHLIFVVEVWKEEHSGEAHERKNAFVLPFSFLFSYKSVFFLIVVLWLIDWEIMF